MTAAWIGPCCLDVDTNNPLSAGGDAHWWDKIYGRLVTYSVKDGAYDQLIPELAESWSTSTDGLVWTIKLRDGVKWHDGEKFTADDVKYSIEVCLDPKGGGCSNAGTLTPIVGVKEFQAGTAKEVTGVKVVDPLTVEITTTAPSANLIDGFAETWMVPKHSLGLVPTDQHKTTDWWTTKAIGTGPFKWKTYTPGQSIELVRNDDYWRGAPKLDGIIRRQFKDPATALLAFEAGEIDFTYVTGDEVARMRQSPIGKIFEGPSGVDNEISFNQVKHPEFANKDVRNAMLMAIDRQAIIDNIYGGSAQLVPCLYGLPSLTGSVTPQKYDAAAAKALLTGAGVKMQPEYVFDTYYNDPLSANVMTAILKNWADVLGIKGGKVVQRIWDYLARGGPSRCTRNRPPCCRNRGPRRPGPAGVPGSRSSRPGRSRPRLPHRRRLFAPEARTSSSSPLMPVGAAHRSRCRPTFHRAPRTRKYSRSPTLLPRDWSTSSSPVCPRVRSTTPTTWSPTCPRRSGWPSWCGSSCWRSPTTSSPTASPPGSPSGSGPGSVARSWSSASPRRGW
jgi:hypothetical protein